MLTRRSWLTLKEYNLCVSLNCCWYFFGLLNFQLGKLVCIFALFTILPYRLHILIAFRFYFLVKHRHWPMCCALCDMWMNIKCALYRTWIAHLYTFYLVSFVRLFARSRSCSHLPVALRWFRTKFNNQSTKTWQFFFLVIVISNNIITGFHCVFLAHASYHLERYCTFCHLAINITICWRRARDRMFAMMVLNAVNFWCITLLCPRMFIWFSVCKWHFLSAMHFHKLEVPLTNVNIFKTTKKNRQRLTIEMYRPNDFQTYGYAQSLWMKWSKTTISNHID